MAVQFCVWGIFLCVLQQCDCGLVLHSAVLPAVTITVVDIGHYACCQVTLSLSLCQSLSGLQHLSSLPSVISL